ncbi:hypothetical protein [Nocardia fluminea]|uniref:hypothetical protein n=1 Tax=Nocardia fluminea TaxID=134984 RepID=UPI00365CD6D9
MRDLTVNCRLGALTAMMKALCIGRKGWLVVSRFQVDETVKAAAASIATLYGRKTMGAASPDELATCVPFVSLVESLVVEDELDVANPAVLLALMKAIDTHARIRVDNSIPLGGREIDTVSKIVHAVGIMIRIDPAAPSGMRSRQDAAGSVLDYSYKEMTSQRKMPRYLEVYCEFLCATLRNAESRSEVLALLNVVNNRGLEEKNSDNPAAFVSGSQLVGRSLQSEGSQPFGLDWPQFQPHRGDDPPLVERSNYFAKVKEWCESGREVLLLAGDSGNGKSTIAREAVQRFSSDKSGTRVAYVDASNVHSFIRTLNNYVVDGPFVSEKDAVDAFVMVIGSAEHQSSSTLVLLDNVATFEQIEQIALWAPRVLITAEEQLIPSDFQRPHHRVDIEPMELDVACELINWFRPDERHDSARFAECVGRKPRIIIDCLGMYEPDDMTLDGMSDLIDAEEARLIQRSGTGQRAVDRLYRDYFIRLESQDMAAAMFLACIAHLSLDSVPIDVSGRTLAEYAAQRPEYGAVSPGNARMYAKPLTRRYLVQRNQTAIRIHGVTAGLFRDVTRADRSEIIRAFIAAYFEFRKTTMTHTAGMIYPELVNWAPTICNVLRSIPVDVRNEFDRDKLSYLVADVRIGMTYIGRFKDYIGLIAAPMDDILTFREESERQIALYRFGMLSRSEFADCMENLKSKIPAPLAEFFLNLHRGFAQYQVREFAAKQGSLIRIETIPDESIAFTYRSTLIVTLIETMEWIGVGSVVLGLTHSVDQNELQRFPSMATEVSGMIVGVYSRQWNRSDATAWFTLLSELSHTHGSDESKFYDTHRLTAKAWLLRCSIIDDASAAAASGGFVEAARIQVDYGRRRDAVGLLSESLMINLMYFGGPANYVGLDLDDDRLLKGLLNTLDEPHIACRLSIVKEYVDCREGSVYSLDMTRLVHETDRAWNAYQDARGYRIGLASQVALLHKRNSRKTEMRTAMQRLSTFLHMRGGFTDVTDALQWIESSCVNRNFVLSV